MGETQIVPAAKITTMAYLAAHPMGVAVAGGILLSIITYYFGKAAGKRAVRKSVA